MNTRAPLRKLIMDRNLESEKQNTKEEGNHSTLVSNGCVNYKRRIADKQATGEWKASPFIIVTEVAERSAFFAISANMMVYLVKEMHQSVPDTATHVLNWVGAAFVLTLLGAFVADAYLGRFLTIITFSCIYAMGMVMLTLSGSIDSLRPTHCTKKPCIPASTKQTAFLYCALTLLSLGTGGIKPCVSSFGADQFDENDQNEAPKKYAFFNWFFFAINMGAFFGITLLVYLREELGWSWGFGIPTGVIICSIFILASGFKKYRYQKPIGSAFTRFVQVIVASVGNQATRETTLYEVDTKESDIYGARKLQHTQQFIFLDKAAVKTDPELNTNNRWRLCTVTQVEEFKSFIRILPVWASTIAFSISFSQLSTFFIAQATKMNRNLSPNFKIPSGSIPIFSVIISLILIPVYEKFIIPFLRSKTGHTRGITSLQRIGIGLFISIISMATAAVVEKTRRDKSSETILSVLWLIPQCFLLGMAEVFAYVGQLEFFYDEATDGTRSISSAVFLSGVGIGSWVSTAIVKIIEKGTGGVEKGWLRDDLDRSRLDYFYWILAGIDGSNLLVFLMVACRFKGREGVIRLPL